MTEDLFIFIAISLGIIIMIDLIFMGVCILKKEKENERNNL